MVDNAISDIRLTTQRLILRPFAQPDLDDLTVLIRDKMASEYAPYDTQWPTGEEAMKDILGYLMGQDMWCAVELKASFCTDAQGNPITFAAGKYEVC